LHPGLGSPVGRLDRTCSMEYRLRYCGRSKRLLWHPWWQAVVTVDHGTLLGGAHAGLTCWKSTRVVVGVLDHCLTVTYGAKMIWRRGCLRLMVACMRGRPLAWRLVLPLKVYTNPVQPHETRRGVSSLPLVLSRLLLSLLEEAVRGLYLACFSTQEPQWNRKLAVVAVRVIERKHLQQSSASNVCVWGWSPRRPWAGQAHDGRDACGAPRSCHGSAADATEEGGRVLAQVHYQSARKG
jgi:hypothetical protein